MFTMQFCLAFLVLLLFFTTNFVNTDKQCRMPNGNTGDCVFWKKCKPLFELNKKRVKTAADLNYLKQSSCGVSSGYRQLFCCPPESQWANFQAIPIVYPDMDMIDLREKPTPITIDQGNDINPRDTDEDKVKVIKYPETKRPPPTNIQGGAECGKDLSNANRIIGGGIAAIDQYPWLALLEYDNGATLCGGSLITTRFVLTAAHCLTKKPKFARLAEFNTSSYPVDYVEVDGGCCDEITVEIIPIEKNIPHPNYTRANHHHDIGLSKLKFDAPITEFIRLICLPTQDFRKSFKTPLNFTVAGWGSNGTQFSEVKKHVKVPYVPNDSCQTVYSFRKISDGQMCAGGVRNEDSCSGDSGGPLMYDFEEKFVAVGVVSYGLNVCGTENAPGVYTYVYQYLDWISDVMQENKPS
ncbi:phenoloxidase-activating enzyme-like [Battus philenor]|uniref:phenoloxidase-activating enzyme-like n=1 Tax=Battus philenor TaxID=42288 RepID=UPI0035CE9E75